MKRISVVILLPLVMFALERVNLIKDHSFEKDSEVWLSDIEGFPVYPYQASVSSHDTTKSFIGSYSSSGDTRSKPEGNLPPNAYEETFITQGFPIIKTIDDVDSLFLKYCFFPREDNFDLIYYTFVFLHLKEQAGDWVRAGYTFGLSASTVLPYVYLDRIELNEDTFWHSLERDIIGDIKNYGIVDLNATVDSIILWVAGGGGNDWRGQKVYWDDVRLMGYADYDVGIKDILSGDGGSPYTPEARIKNFGREPADSFLVIAEISKDETIHYADTMPWSLPADTEDTVSFSEFTPPDTGTYVLRIYTVMEPDESDADDELSKELDFTAIAEPPIPITHLGMKVRPLTSGDVYVSYVLPQGHTGTLTLFDLSGRRVDAKQVKGYGSASFDSEFPSGVYFVKLEALGIVLSRKIVVVE